MHTGVLFLLLLIVSAGCFRFSLYSRQHFGCQYRRVALAAAYGCALCPFCWALWLAVTSASWERFTMAILLLAVSLLPPVWASEEADGCPDELSCPADLRPETDPDACPEELDAQRAL